MKKKVTKTLYPFLLAIAIFFTAISETAASNEPPGGGGDGTLKPSVYECFKEGQVVGYYTTCNAGKNKCVENLCAN